MPAFYYGMRDTLVANNLEDATNIGTYILKSCFIRVLRCSLFLKEWG